MNTPLKSRKRQAINSITLSTNPNLYTDEIIKSDDESLLNDILDDAPKLKKKKYIPYFNVAEKCFTKSDEDSCEESDFTSKGGQVLRVDNSILDEMYNLSDTHPPCLDGKMLDQLYMKFCMGDADAPVKHGVGPSPRVIYYLLEVSD